MEDSISNRIFKYRFHYAVVIPAMILLFVFKVIPLFQGFVISFTDYKIISGITGSRWMGLDNYIDLFNSIAFRRALVNTVTLKFGYIFITAILAIIVALALSMITNKTIKKTFSAVFLLPYFIPVAVFCYFAMIFLSPVSSPITGIKIMPLSNPGYFRITVLLMEVVRNVGIPAVIALAAYERAREGHKFSAVFKTAAAFVFFQLTTLLTFDYEFMNMLLNPLVYQVADTMESVAYRSGILQAQYGLDSALWVFRFIVQLMLTIPVYFLLRSLFKRDLFGDATAETQEKDMATDAVGIPLSLVLALVPAAVIFIVFIYPLVPGNTVGLSSILDRIPSFFGSYFTYIFIGLFAAMLNTAIAITLAYPLTVKRLPGRTAYKIVLLILLVAGTGYPPISEYLFFRRLGMVNTVFPHIIGGMFTLVNVFILKSVFNSRYSGLKEKAEKENQGELSQFFTLFIPKTWKAIAGLFIIQFIAIWNSYLYPLMYSVDIQKSSPMLFLRNLAIGARDPDIPFNDPAIMKLAMIIALPSLILFLLGSKFINAELLTGKMRK